MDDMNAKGTFNHSSLQIIETSELVEPTGWFPGRQYYVVTEGLRVGVFHDLSVTYLLPIYTAYIQGYRSDVRQSVDPLPKLRPLWVTCRTWANAVQTWDMACRAEKVHILRKNSGGATYSDAANSPMPHRRIKAPVPRSSVSDNIVDVSPPRTSTTSTPLFPVSKNQFSSAIVISDSESDSYSVSSDDSDSRSEASSTKAIDKKIDRFNITGDENGDSTLGQTHKAATKTYFDHAPTRTKDSSGARDVRCIGTTTLKHHRCCSATASGPGYKSSNAFPIAPMSQGDPARPLHSTPCRFIFKSRCSANKHRKLL